MHPKVSVIIPVYGVEKYIERCAISLFEQTLDSIEYIFVNDCTPDNSIEILNNVLLKYPNRKEQTRIVSMPTNSGQAAVRRHGIQLATGEYIIHCDSDDWVEPTMYEDLYNEAVRGNHDMVICDYYLSKSLDDNLHVIQDIDVEPHNLMHQILSEEIHSSVCNKLIKASVYNNDIMYPQYNLREDLALTCQLLYYSKSVGYINKPYYHYFCNTESITQKKLSKEKSIERSMQAIYNCQLMDAFLMSKGVNEEYQTDMICMKLKLKNSLAKLASNRIGRKQWMEIFPDISTWRYMTSNTPLRSKIVYLLISWQLYHFLKGLLIIYK